MTTTVQSPYTNEQIAIWLRGLLTIAWADGYFADEEKILIANLTEIELASEIHVDSFEPVTSAELAVALGQAPDTAENFLRTAVMVAIADGVYSQSEDDTLRQFCTALKLQPAMLDALRQMLYEIETPSPEPTEVKPLAAEALSSEGRLVILRPVQDWLDNLEVDDPKLAHFFCRMIPAQCPFERDVNLFGRKIAHIPPMCKLNPLYEQLVGLRFRALSYLADECNEDVTPYLQ
jgi:tellurite resistance protein